MDFGSMFGPIVQQTFGKDQPTPQVVQQGLVVPENKAPVAVAVPFIPADMSEPLPAPKAPELPGCGDIPMDCAGNPELIKDPLNACITAMLNQLMENGTTGSSVIVPYSGMKWYSPRTNTPVSFEAFRNRVRAIIGTKRPYIKQSLFRYASSGCDEVRQGMELTLTDKGA